MSTNDLLVTYSQTIPEGSNTQLGWYAAVENNPVPYRFFGETADDQLQQVNALSIAMGTNDVDYLIDQLPNILVWDGATATPEQMVNFLFGTTDGILWDTIEEFVTADAAEVLLDDLVAAGQFLGKLALAAM